MTISPAPSIRRCLPLLLAGLVIALPAHHAGAQLPPSRHVVATGDDVPPYGVIGHPGGTPLALDERGRALVVADAADGTRALLWTDGNDPDVIWHGSPDPTSSGIDAASAVASRDGRRVLALGGLLVPPASGGAMPPSRSRARRSAHAAPAPPPPIPARPITTAVRSVAPPAPAPGRCSSPPRCSPRANSDADEDHPQMAQIAQMRESICAIRVICGWLGSPQEKTN